MKIALIAGEKGVKCVGSGVNSSINRLSKSLGKKHEIKLIYGNQRLPKPLNYLPFGEIKEFDIVHAGACEFAAFISSPSPIVATFYDNLMCKPSIYLRGTKGKINRFLLRTNKKILQFLIKRGLAKCHKVIAISRQAQKGAVESFHIPEEKIVIIPPGIDTDTFKPLNFQPKDKNKLKLFFCGGIGKRKGVDLLFQAIQILKRKIKVELWLAGSTHPLFPLHQIITELDLTKVVKYFGFVSDKKLNRLYNQADIFVFPSAGEGYGIPPLEALSCGTKVVCSQIPSIKPFGNSVVLTEINPQSIAKNILKATNKEFNFDSVRQKIEKDYSVRATCKKHLELYQKLISK